MNKKNDLVRDLLYGIESFDDGYEMETVAIKKKSVKRFAMAAGFVTWTYITAAVSFQLGVSSVGCAVVSMEENKRLTALGSVVAEKRNIPRKDLWQDMFQDLGQPVSYTSINKCNYNSQIDWLIKSAN